MQNLELDEIHYQEEKPAPASTSCPASPAALLDLVFLYTLHMDLKAIGIHI